MKQGVAVELLPARYLSIVYYKNNVVVQSHTTVEHPKTHRSLHLYGTDVVVHVLLQQPVAVSREFDGMPR